MHEPATGEVERSVGPETGATSPEPISAPIDALPQPQDHARLLLRDVESYVTRICAEPQKADHVAAELGVPWSRRFQRIARGERLRNSGDRGLPAWSVNSPFLGATAFSTKSRHLEGLTQRFEP